MKKFIAFIIATFFTVAAFAQKPDTSVSSLPDTAKVTASKVYNDVKGALSSLGSLLKTGSEHVYGVLVRQSVVDSVAWIVIDIVLIIATILVIKNTFRLLSNFKNGGKWQHDEWDEHGSSIFFCVLSLALFVATTVCIIASANTIITGFVNPEFGALKTIFELINPPK